MADVIKRASSTTYIRSASPYQGSMTVWALRDFVKALDEEGVPDDTTLTAHHAHDTQHFTGVSVRITKEDPHVG